MLCFCMCILFYFGGMKVAFGGSLREFPIIICVGVCNDETVKYINFIYSYFFLSVIVPIRCCGMCSKYRQPYFLGT